MNELLFIAAIVVDIIFILLLFQFGKAGLYAGIIINLILTFTFGSKLITVFGYTSNVGNITYGALFLSANLLIEFYGKKTALKAIWFTFLGNMFFVTMGQFIVRFSGNIASTAANEAILTLFASSTRIALASIASYLLVQYFNVFLYSFLLEKTGGKYLWLRYGASILLSQFFDSLIFFSAAFYLILPNNLLIEAMIVGFALKMVVGFITLPFMYVEKLLKKETEHVH